MTTPMRIRTLSLLLAAGCAKSISGPTPTVSGAVNERDQSTGPAYVCNAQGDPVDGWLVDAIGDHFAPIPTGALGKTTGIAMPKVTLTGPESYTLPEAYVRFHDRTRMPLAMRTADTAADAHALAPGDYDLTVTNLNNASGTAAAAIRVIPPPTETQVQVQPAGGTPGAPNVCADQATQTLVIDGTGFRSAAPPVVSLVSSSGSTVLTLPGSAVTVVSPTEIDAVITGSMLAGLGSASGSVYTVTVTDPAGCAAPYGAAPRAFGVTDVKVYTSCVLLGTLALNPRFGWQQKNQAITISNTFSAPATHGFSGGAPTVTITATLKGSTTPTQIPLRRVAFLNPNTITALVPTCSGMSSTPFSDTGAGGCPNGIVPGGPYEVDIQDPSGATGTLGGPQGFFVTQSEPPVISAIAPSAIDTGGVAHLVISSGGLTGTNFPATSKPQIVFPAGNNIRACDLTVNSQTTSSIDAAVQSVAASKCVEYDPTGAKVAAAGGFSLSNVGLYVIRVQDTATPANGDYSGLIITQPSANPSAATPVKSSLSTARADFPLVQAGDDIGNRYLYALGGISGPVGKSSSTALSSIEMAQISEFGDVGGDCSGASCVFRVLDRTQLGFTGGTSTTPAPRRGVSAVSIQVPGDTGYVFAIGGIDPSGHAVTTVERAQVLKAADAPIINSPITLADTGGNLASGTWYYRVSALLAASDAKNPGGETLASDIEPATSRTATSKATLSWACNPNAVKYRIFRTVNPNDRAGTETLLNEVTKQATCTGSPLPNESYIDDGGNTPSGLKPQPDGALGRWVAMPSLGTARGEASAKVVGNRVYVAGGCSTATGTPACDGTGAVEAASYEDSTLTVDTIDGFSSSGTLNQARRQAGLAIASKVTAPDRFVTTHAGDVWLVLAGGMQGGSALTNNGGGVEVAQVVTAGAAPAATPTFANASYGAAGFGVMGGWAEVVADIFFIYGTPGTNFAFKSNDVCNGSPCTASTSFTGTLNDTGASAGSRYLPGETLFRAYIYTAGGLTNATTGAGATATALSTVDRILY